jgi:hypothetical protein
LDSQLTSNPASDTSASWSPDGNWLLYKWNEIHGGGDNKHTTYDLAFEFNPIEAAMSTSKLTLRAEVAKGFWEQMTQGQSIAVRYSRDNPEIVLLEEE